jgi:hypothetical protein
VWVTNCALELRLLPCLGQPRAAFPSLGFLATLAWKHRFIRIDDAGVHVRFSRFRKFDVAWPDLIDMEFHDDAVLIHNKSGRRLIPLGRYGNAIEIRDTLREAFARRALPGAT